MTSSSLRTRLLVGAAVWVVLTVVVTGLVLFYLFLGSVERQTRADLEATFERLVAVIEIGPNGATVPHTLPDPRYAQPYSGVYWQVKTEDGSLIARSRSLWDHVLELPSPSDAMPVLAGPENQTLAAVVKVIDFGDPTMEKLVIWVAQDRSILDQTIADFGSDLILALATLGAAIVAGAIVVVRIGLAPLDLVRRGVERVRRGTDEQLVGPYPAEVVPLVTEVNELLSLREKSVQFARTRAADLAHGLKTPLQVLGSIADELSRSGDKGTAERVVEIRGEMSDRIDYQLRLARLRLRTSSEVLNSSLGVAVSRTVGVVRQAHIGRGVTWTVNIDEDVSVNVDANDLLELVGVLVENAAKWAKSKVQIAVHSGAGWAELHIADDGTGVSSTQISALGRRGHRLDESRQGTGLGLSIAFEIVEMNGGAIELGRADLGGLSVKVRMPCTANREQR
ncbi:sensor histidine kinase [Devosia sp.]|uniref:sensor histidine kinase n=1 Tax=Devosia sp. TaxID=1871048 RepID=UPI0027377C1A|nr:HAMP domain-containing sensor histidine kinase [Devosia sp.]MDP2778914.1 HAMP domain-containing sensor histidine kinase [Devosia sp.]